MFADRLVNDEDRSWFSNLLSERIVADFNETLDNVVTSDPLMYADFMALSRDSPPYVEITDHTKVTLADPFNSNDKQPRSFGMRRNHFLSIRQGQQEFAIARFGWGHSTPEISPTPCPTPWG